MRFLLRINLTNSVKSNAPAALRRRVDFFLTPPGPFNGGQMPATAHRFSQADTNDTKQQRGDIRPIQHIIRYIRNILRKVLLIFAWSYVNP